MEQTRAHHIKRERGFFPAVLLALLATVVFLAALLLLCSLLLARAENPLALIPVIGNGCAMLCAFLCGFVAARLRGRQGLLCGIAAGVGYLLFFLLAATVLTGEGILHTGMLLFSSLCFLTLSVLGGMLGGIKRIKRRHRRIHR